MNRNVVAGILASAALALVCAFVFAALTVYGVIDMGLARILLAMAWVIGVAGTAISDFVWEKGRKYQVLAPLIVAVLLGVSFWRLDVFVLVTKTAQAKAELQKQQSNVLVTSPTPTPTKGPVKIHGTNRVATVTPSPTPILISSDELAEKVAKKLAGQQPTPTPTPIPTPTPPCRGDNLIQCTDDDLLEWGKPLVAEIARFYKYYQDDSSKAANAHSVKAMFEAEYALADRFRDCCAEDAAKYYREITSRVGGGKAHSNFLDWEQKLMKPMNSREWKDARNEASRQILDIRYELELRMIDLHSAIEMAKIKKLNH